MDAERAPSPGSERIPEEAEQVGDADADGSAGGAAAASSRPVGEAILQLLASSPGGSDRGQDSIQDLQGQRRALTDEKRRLTKQLRNETRKRKRVLNKSARLSNMDLVEVLQIRQNRAAAKAKSRAEKPPTE